MTPMSRRLARQSLVTLAALAALVPALHAQGSRTPLTRGLTVIRNVHVIPMTDTSIIRNAAVVVRDGRVERVGPASQVATPSGARVIDGNGGYLMPGLADMHTHLYADQHIPDSIGRQEVGVMLANGITTARLMIGTPAQLALRREIEGGRVIGPNLYTASPHLTGRPDTNARVVRTPDEGRAAVRELGPLGYDFIKITNWIAPPVYEAIMDEANKAGYRVDGHVNAGVTVERASTLGQHQQHLDGWFEALLPDSAKDRPSLTQYGVYDLKRWPTLDIMDERRIAPLAGTVARSKVWVTPTLVLFNTFFAIGESDEDMRGRPDWGLIPARFRGLIVQAMGNYWSLANAMVRTPERRERYVELRGKIVKALADSGARLLAGSDAPDFLMSMGYTLHRELEALAGAGLTPWQVLATATRNPAEFLGASEEWGTIAPGRRADLVLLAANPLEDIRNTARVEATSIGGRWITRNELDEMVASARRAINP
jgi:cytosine/adenosine deaminase-related metal-dependent hydrolase